jgi:hypothetical protein
MDGAADTGALSQLRYATGGQVTGYPSQIRRNNLRTALVLGSVAALFFAAVIVKYLWLVQ